MKRKFLYIVRQAVILAVLTGCPTEVFPEEVNYAACLDCHGMIEKPGRGHDFECARCHLAPERRLDGTLATHDSIIRNPSDLAYAETACNPCHQQKAGDHSRRYSCT